MPVAGSTCDRVDMSARAINLHVASRDVGVLQRNQRSHMSPRNDDKRPSTCRTGRRQRVVAWTPEGDEQKRLLRGALRPHADVCYCGTEPQLWDALGDASVGAFVLELGIDSRPDAESLVSSVSARYPGIHIIGYGWLSQVVAADVLVCARVGLDTLALRGYCDLGQVIQCAIASSQEAEEVVLRDVSELLPPDLLSLVRPLLQRLADAPTLNQLAKLSGRTPRTLQRLAHRTGCCSPGDLMCAVRVLVAAYLFAIERATTQRVLDRTGYSSTRMLRAALARCGVASPRSLREPGGYARARKAVLRFLESRDLCEVVTRPE